MCVRKRRRRRCCGFQLNGVFELLGEFAMECVVGSTDIQKYKRGRWTVKTHVV